MVYSDYHNDAVNRGISSIDVSFVVAIYNPDISKLIMTLDSILKQKDVILEIIVCDDGSRESVEAKVRDYFDNNNFSNYKMIFNKINRGTVGNILSGLSVAEGKFTKLFSPGDYLVGEFTIREWIDWIVENKAMWSFSDSFYYRIQDGRKEYLKIKADPQFVSPYLKNKKQECIWNYVVLRDVALGAAILGHTSIQYKYCKSINENGIKYGEDNIWRLMMFDGIVGNYFPKETIYYEHGVGISTSPNTQWRKKLLDDWRAATGIMIMESNPSTFQAKMIKALNEKKGIRQVFVRGKIKYWIKYHMFQRKANVLRG